MVCPNCAAENNDSAAFCKKCGQSLLAGWTCKRCGAQNDADAVFCGKCGNRMQDGGGVDKAPDMPKMEQKRKKKMGLLAGLAAAVIVIAVAVGIFVVRPVMLRAQVDRYIENMQYAKAQAVYEKLPETMQDQTEYLMISLLADIENGNYVAASSKLIRLGGYEDAADLVDQADRILGLINGKGISLPAEQSNIISNVIESIASEAQDKKQEELEKDHLSSLVGTWKRTEYWAPSYGQWKEYSADTLASVGIPDIRNVYQYNADGTLDITDYRLCALYETEYGSETIDYYEDRGWNVEQLYVYPEGTLAYGEAMCRMTLRTTWKTEGDDTLLYYIPGRDGELEMRYQFTINGDLLTFLEDYKFQRQ